MPFAGFAAPAAGKRKRPGRSAGRKRVIFGRARGQGLHLPARLGRSAAMEGPLGQKQARCCPACRSKAEPARAGEIGSSRGNFRDDKAEALAAQRLLQRPEKIGRLAQARGDELLAGKAEPLQAMAAEPAEFTSPACAGKPQHRSRTCQPAPGGKACGKADGGGHVGPRGRCQLMQALGRKPVGGQMAVEFGKPREPAGAGACPFQPLQPGDAGDAGLKFLADVGSGRNSLRRRRAVRTRHGCSDFQMFVFCSNPRGQGESSQFSCQIAAFSRVAKETQAA